MSFTLSMKISGGSLKCMKMDFCCCLFGVCLGLLPSEPQLEDSGGRRRNESKFKDSFEFSG